MKYIIDLINLLYVEYMINLSLMKFWTKEVPSQLREMKICSKWFNSSDLVFVISCHYFVVSTVALWTDKGKHDYFYYCSSNIAKIESKLK